MKFHLFTPFPEFSPSITSTSTSLEEPQVPLSSLKVSLNFIVSNQTNISMLSSFEAISIYLGQESIYDLNWNRHTGVGTDFVTSTLVGVLSVCLILTIAAFLNGKYKKADNVNILRLLLFGVWTTDFVTDEL